jgi:UDP-glucose 4-epimerase
MTTIQGGFVSNILITGGAGFIGSHLVDAFVSRGHSVRVVDNLATGFYENIARHDKKIEFIQGDIAELELAREACRDIEFVQHHAAVPSVPRSVSEPFVTQHSGEIAMLTLLEACVERKVRRVTLAASSSAYGGSKEFPAKEEMAPAPLSPYAASKLACEYYLRAYVHCRGIDGIALRYFNVFGPRQNPKSQYSAVIPTFINRMSRGERPHILGDGEQSRDFTYVANVIDANLLAVQIKKELKGTVCNVGCGGHISLKAVVSAINAELNSSLEPTFGPPRPGDPICSQADISRAKELLGYVPQVSFVEGIRRLVTYRPDQ